MKMAVLKLIFFLLNLEPCDLSTSLCLLVPQCAIQPFTEYREVFSLLLLKLTSESNKEPQQTVVFPDTESAVLNMG